MVDQGVIWLLSPVTGSWPDAVEAFLDTLRNTNLRGLRETQERTGVTTRDGKGYQVKKLWLPTLRWWWTTPWPQRIGRLFRPVLGRWCACGDSTWRWGSKCWNCQMTDDAY